MSEQTILERKRYKDEILRNSLTRLVEKRKYKQDRHLTALHLMEEKKKEAF